jgi:hypothetical protein
LFREGHLAPAVLTCRGSEGWTGRGAVTPSTSAYPPEYGHHELGYRPRLDANYLFNRFSTVEGGWGGGCSAPFWRCGPTSTRPPCSAGQGPLITFRGGPRSSLSLDCCLHWAPPPLKHRGAARELFTSHQRDTGLVTHLLRGAARGRGLPAGVSTPSYFCHRHSSSVPTTAPARPGHGGELSELSSASLGRVGGRGEAQGGRMPASYGWCSLFKQERRYWFRRWTIGPPFLPQPSDTPFLDTPPLLSASHAL